MAETTKTEKTETKTEQQVQSRPLEGVAITGTPETTEQKTETTETTKDDK